MKKLFGTDGIRGIAGKDLTTDLAEKVGRALVLVLQENHYEDLRVLIGMDTRLSSPEIALALAEGIKRGGADAITIGVCSTPAVAYLVKKHEFPAGIMISASHNPYIYNGIKIFGGDGFKISDDWERKIEEIIEGDEFHSSQKIGVEDHLSDGTGEYIDYLADSYATPLCGIKVGIDCANGSASVSAENLFSRLGAECYMLADKPDGKNINENCGSMHLDALKSLVIEKKLNLGIAFDGDSDRCLAVDENGIEIDGDHIMAILSLWMKEEGELASNTLVGTVMSNIGLVKFCREHNIHFVTTKVGDRFVLEKMNLDGYVLGGEQSGHIIIRKHATTGDGQLTALALLSRIKKSGKSLSALASVMKKYPQYMTNLNADNVEKEIFQSSDEIRLIIESKEKQLEQNGRLLIRPSGTEPLIRIMAEGEDLELIKSICEELKAKINEVIQRSKSSVR